MKYFLKAPWQSEGEEVTKEQFFKSQLDFMATYCHLQSLSFIPRQFKSTHGVEGWVEEEKNIEVKCPMCGFLAEKEDTVPFSMKGEYYVLTSYKCPSCVSNFYL